MKNIYTVAFAIKRHQVLAFTSCTRIETVTGGHWTSLLSSRKMVITIKLLVIPFIEILRENKIQ